MSYLSQSYFIYALHGFLGQGSDWSQTFSGWDANDQIVCPSYFSDPDFIDLKLENFYKNITSSLVENFSKKIFIGYSLGGRIGLKILEHFPDLFDHYIFISSHSGLNTDILRQARCAIDSVWMNKIRDLSWDDFLLQWNAQDVLQGTLPPIRNAINYDQQRLILSLFDHSLGRQKDYSDLIKKHQNKVSWVVGDQDIKFLDLAEDLMQKKILLDYKRIFSGHRILFDNSKDLQKSLKEIILEFQ